MPSAARALVPLLALAAVLAGCAAPAAVQPSSLVGLPALLPEVPGAPIVQDHDHGDVALHGDSFAMALVARASGYDGPVPAGVGFGELDVKDGWAYVCRGGARGGGLGPLPATMGGFVAIDVSDPRAPRNAGAFDGPGCSDIKVNDANDLVFYGTQRNAPFEVLTNAGATPLERAPRGIHLVGVADKAAPALERFVPLPVNGVHTLHYASIDGRELLFAQTYDWVPDAGFGIGVSTGLTNPATQRIQVFEVVRGADGLRDLRPLGAFAVRTPEGLGANHFPHDITVQKHPLTGQWLGYVAYWDLGLVVVNLEDPGRPEALSVFADTSPSARVALHQARPFATLIGGKHVTVLEPEIQAGDETGQFTLVDTTDPANPKRLGHWTLPGELVIPGGFLFSPHNFNTANGRIYLAHNHAGVWVLDAASEERLARPAAVGYYQPHAWEREDEGCQSRLWSAFYVDGFVYASDSCSGLNILQFDGDRGLEGAGPRRVMPTG